MNDLFVETGTQYQARFGNLRDVLPPEFYGDEQVIALMQEALKTGQPLTEELLKAKLPNYGWEGVRR